MKNILIVAAAILPLFVFSRPLSLKLANSTTLAKSKDSIISSWANESKFKVGILSVGKPGAVEATNTLKIVAATVAKNARTKKTYINDIQELTVDTNTVATAFQVFIASGCFEKRQDVEDKRWTCGWMADGVIVEVWSGGVMQKRLATFSGPLAKSSLDISSVSPLYLESDCLYDDAIPRTEPPYQFHNKTMIKIAGRQATGKK